MNFSDNDINTIAYAVARALSEFSDSVDSDDREVIESLLSVQSKIDVL